MKWVTQSQASRLLHNKFVVVLGDSSKYDGCGWMSLRGNYQFKSEGVSGADAAHFNGTELI